MCFWRFTKVWDKKWNFFKIYIPEVLKGINYFFNDQLKRNHPFNTLGFSSWWEDIRVNTYLYFLQVLDSKGRGSSFKWNAEAWEQFDWTAFLVLQNLDFSRQQWHFVWEDALTSFPQPSRKSKHLKKSKPDIFFSSCFSTTTKSR